MSNTAVLGMGEGLGVAETVAAESETRVARATLVSTQARTTVLPRRAEEGPAATGMARRFHHVKPLGEGGMGEVLLALDEDIQRRVAIKRMRGDRTSEAMLLRFADEVRIIGQLEHPSIVPVHDVGVDDDGQLYLVMKYVAGDTLEKVIEQLRAGDPEFVARFPTSKRVEIMAKILEALAYAHTRGFVHRDLKPANVMIGPYGEVTLMDWGIAKQIGAREHEPEVDELAITDERRGRLVETQAGTLLGTPMYMSPEQAEGRNAELDARSDVFAAGLLAVELFTLAHPLAGLASVSAVLATLMHQDLGLPDRLGPCFTGARAPAELMWFSTRALARKPEDRYRDAGAMLDELRCVQAGKIRITCPLTLTKAAANGFLAWVDRNPMLWIGMLVTTALLLTGGIVTGIVFAIRALMH